MSGTSIWIVILVSSIAMLVIRLIGHFLPNGVIDHERTLRIIGLMPIVLLAALVGVQTMTIEGSIAIDHRLAGLLAGAVALYFKRSFITVMLVAGVTGSLIHNVI